jgi:hypothetical protein
MIKYVIKVWEDELQAYGYTRDDLIPALSLLRDLRAAGNSATLWLQVGDSDERCLIDVNQSWVGGVDDPSRAGRTGGVARLRRANATIANVVELDTFAEAFVLVDSSGRERFRMDAAGRFYVNGEHVTYRPEIVDAFCAFIARGGL